LVALLVLAAGGYYLRAHHHRQVPPPNPPQVIRIAAARAAASSSASATFTTQVGGLTVMSGTISERLRPAPMADLTMTTVDGAERFAVEEVVTGSDVYLKIPGLAPGVGKPWVEVPVTQLSANPALDELYQTNAIPTNGAGLIAAATSARRAGTAPVDGVLTTRYVGTIDPATAAATLTSTVRQLLAPELKSVTGAIGFVAWIDGQHNFREIQTSAAVGGRSTLTTIVFTTTRAVQIAVPVASQVAMAPVGTVPAS
jgi:hypothetical protein